MTNSEIELLQLKREKLGLQIEDVDLQIQIKKLEYETPKTIKPKTATKSRIRKYGKSAISNRPKIQFLIMPEDVVNKPQIYTDSNVGHFQLSKGKISKYSINDLYLLKKEIANTKEYTNFTELGLLIDLNPTSTSALCLMIEEKLLDPYFEFWIDTFGKPPIFNKNRQLIA